MLKTPKSPPFNGTMRPFKFLSYFIRNFFTLIHPSVFYFLRQNGVQKAQRVPPSIKIALLSPEYSADFGLSQLVCTLFISDLGFVAADVLLVNLISLTIASNLSSISSLILPILSLLFCPKLFHLNFPGNQRYH